MCLQPVMDTTKVDSQEKNPKGRKEGLLYLLSSHIDFIEGDLCWAQKIHILTLANAPTHMACANT